MPKRTSTLFFFPFIILTFMILSGCSSDTTQFEIGSATWEIHFPDDYVHRMEGTKTQEFNAICGTPLESSVTQIFEVQEHDTNWVDPIPNIFAAFYAPDDFLKGATLPDCVESLTTMYDYVFGMNNVNFENSAKKIRIDGQTFQSVENVIYKADGTFSHGDMHYIAHIGHHVLHVQMSYHSKKERDRMVEAVESSRFRLN